METIKKWFGVSKFDERLAKLESVIGKRKEKARSNSLMFHYINTYFEWDKKDEGLVHEIDSLRADFEELDKKFDALERYLKVEFFKEDTEIQVYDWADKNHKEGFRATKKTYEEMKKDKESKENDGD